MLERCFDQQECQPDVKDGGEQRHKQRGERVLAGGIGTLEEMAEMWTLNVLGYQNKPMALLNTAGYYDDYLKYLARMQAEGFAGSQHLARLRVGSEVVATLEDLAAQI